MKKILIVDDDAELMANLSDILKEEGYYVDEAASGKMAIEKAAYEGFDIVLLDLMMPKMSGIDVLKELRRISPNTRIIMITAFATVENAVDAIKKGASDYISKPFKIDEFLITIRRVLEEAKFEDGIKELDFDHTLASLSNPIRRKVIRLLCLRTGMRFMDITRKLGIEDHTKVVFHLKMLKDSGLIEQDNKRFKKLYTLTKEGEKIVDCLKILEDYISTSSAS
ncbi:MAG: response regulator [Deltaproteobacteria bacterium]|nr:response regulator [Deltaproteobacteria bacterium]